jgi:hypothetical protein
MPLYSTAEITPNCNIGHPMKHPQFKQFLHLTALGHQKIRILAVLTSAQLHCRSLPQNGTCQESSKSFKVYGFWAPQKPCILSLAGWSMSFSSFVNSSSVGVPFRANRIWCSGSKPFMTVVEGESHELRSDKKSPLATALAIGATMLSTKTKPRIRMIKPALVWTRHTVSTSTGSNLQYVHDFICE